VPTIYHRARFLRVGTLSLCPPHARRTDLRCAQAQSRRTTATNQHDRQITSDYPKSCQVWESKIFRFRSNPNQSHNSARLTQSRDARDRHERAVRCGGRGGRDRRARRKRTAKSCGSGAAVLALSSGEAKLLAGDGGKRAVLRGEHEVSRKAIAQGRPECSRCPVCSCALLFAQIARETAGAASTRSSLRPVSKRAK
jgi:hypothetical protein